MKKYLAIAVLVIGIPAAATAQSSTGGAEAYVGVLGGYQSFDRDSEFGTSPTYGSMAGALVSGVAGANVPIGPLFVGVEGNVAKGFQDIDWEYGAKGRVGVRAGDGGLLYVSAGHQWVNGKSDRGFSDQKDWTYGLGVEVGPRAFSAGSGGGTGGPRLRLQADTYDFVSIRPMAGLVFAF
jgi:outer membrane immunogenic protein